MKTTLLIVLIICGAFFSCNAPQQEAQEPQTSQQQNMDQAMTNEQLSVKLALALNDMKAKAIEMGIEGVAAASVLNKGEKDDWIGQMKVVGPPCNVQEGWNLVAIAWSKCGEVIATQADSGDPNHKKILGELNFTGGAYDEYQGIKLAFAFSGATSDEDMVVARHGIEKMKGYLAEK